MQVGQPVVRVAQGKLQLGVVLDSKASSLLVAGRGASRIAPGTTVNKSQVRCACRPSCLSGFRDIRNNVLKCKRIRRACLQMIW